MEKVAMLSCFLLDKITTVQNKVLMNSVATNLIKVPIYEVKTMQLPAVREKCIYFIISW